MPTTSKPECSIVGCEKPARGHGWCSAHYTRWRRNGHPLAVKPPRPIRLCEVDGCGRKHSAHGFCRKHRERYEKHGDPTVLAFRSGESSPMWVGERVSYSALHTRIRHQRGWATEHPCAECGEPANEWAFDEPTGYSTDLSRYRPLCYICHRKADALSA